MLFNSIHFLFFFPLLLLVYFAIPHRFRWVLLLLASYYFYMCWRPAYIILIIASTLVDYVAGIQIARSGRPVYRRLWLGISLLVNLGLLGTFKYWNFFMGALDDAFSMVNVSVVLPEFELLLPVGISFYTFQTLSYTIDIYRRQREPERNLGVFALYVVFFPQLVAGPIERSVNLLPQFFKKVKFNYEQCVSGLMLMTWGFFKKVVVADRLAPYVDQVYSSPDGYEGMAYVLATYFFAFQIYADFSGYTDIARGCARALGFDLMVNFRTPYVAKNIVEFWRRWHISLSTWFRDYVYVPLGGNRVVFSHWIFNILAVFLISGLWHGANYTFLIWGAIHGVVYLITVLLTKARSGRMRKGGRRPRWKEALQILLTFHIVCVAWVFFRADSLQDAVQILQNIVLKMSICHPQISLLNYDLWSIMGSVAIIILLECIQYYQRKISLFHFIRKQPVWARWSLYVGSLLVIYFFGNFNSDQFIYFQF